MRTPFLLGSMALAGLLAAGLALAGDDPFANNPLAAKAAPDKLEAANRLPPQPFVRLKKDKAGKTVALQTAVVRYVPAKGKGNLSVDLVGVVHIGDRPYYDQLNDRFEQYDAVLYELVAPPGARVPQDRKGGSDNPIAFLQKAMTMILNLDSQLDCVDYTCTNFVHADLSPAEMAEAMRKRGDTPLTLTLSVVADILREQNLQQMRLEQGGGVPGPNFEDVDPLGALLDPQGPVKLKAVMAEQLATMADGTGLGKTLNTILVDDRNAACMKVFQKEMVAGKEKIAIFYGAAHMPDFDRRLREDYGLRRASVEWYTAWDLRPRQMNMLDLLNRFAK